MKDRFCVPSALILFTTIVFACGDEAGSTPDGSLTDGGTGEASIPLSCTNGRKDGDESDVDCGGSCNACPDGKVCAATRDCVGKCSSGTCATAPTQLAAGAHSVCALFSDGTVKCWGGNNTGRLGLGDTNDRGYAPGEMGANLPVVDLGAGRKATSIVVSFLHSCATFDDGTLKCWGTNEQGQLGLGDVEGRGGKPGQMGDKLPVVDLGTGRTVKSIGLGVTHSCALLDNGTVKCWGDNNAGQLGLGDTNNRGDQPGEMGDALPAVDLGSGRTAKALAIGHQHSCALLDNDTVKCWGDNSAGQLGLGDTNGRGDQPGELGDALPAIDLGTGRTVKATSAGNTYACALLDNDALKCWGGNGVVGSTTYGGNLGLGDLSNRGDAPGEMGDNLPAVDLGSGRRATSISAGFVLSCAILDNSALKCWGYNNNGQLGLGDTNSRGDGPNEMGDALPAIDLGAGRTAISIQASDNNFACALLDDRSVKCWGVVAPGLGDTTQRGDGPGEMGDALPPIPLL